MIIPIPPRERADFEHRACRHTSAYAPLLLQKMQRCSFSFEIPPDVRETKRDCRSLPKAGGSSGMYSGRDIRRLAWSVEFGVWSVERRATPVFLHCRHLDPCSSVSQAASSGSGTSTVESRGVQLQRATTSQRNARPGMTSWKASLMSRHRTLELLLFYLEKTSNALHRGHIVGASLLHHDTA